MVEVCETVGVGGEGQRAGLSTEQVGQVFEALLTACEDYSSDKRGDVGSWSRVVSLGQGQGQGHGQGQGQGQGQDDGLD